MPTLFVAVLIATFIVLYQLSQPPITARDMLISIMPAWLQGLGTVALAYVGWHAFITWREQTAKVHKADATTTMIAPASGRQPVLIPAGTSITCERGHQVCVTAVNLNVNEPLAVEMFTGWQIAAPQPGDMFPRCGVCGAAAYRETRDGVMLHTPEGWR